LGVDETTVAERSRFFIIIFGMLFSFFQRASRKNGGFLIIVWRGCFAEAKAILSRNGCHGFAPANDNVGTAVTLPVFGETYLL
jgi:hypothetical protein